jgi:hypothetical protein
MPHGRISQPLSASGNTPFGKYERAGVLKMFEYSLFASHGHLIYHSDLLVLNPVALRTCHDTKISIRSRNPCET